MKKRGIAIDGPAGAGKSTIVKIVASKLKINSVDSGSLYRTIAYCLKENGISIEDVLEMPDEELKGTLNAMKIEPKFEESGQVNYLNGDPVEDKLLRTEEISMNASKVSQNGLVREKVTEICQSLAKSEDVVMEGRDIGTVVMPNALLKVYLDADPEERAKRRILQLKEKGQKAPSLDEMIEDIKKRDNQDMTREISPLKKADDAMTLDSTSLTIEEVCKFIVDEYKNRA
ncbi:MAG: (d)CMP kinase [Clostridia bacterium]|nr:(d)CMP kinase [Clostridia bacterium]